MVVRDVVEQCQASIQLFVEHDSCDFMVEYKGGECDDAIRA